MKMKKAILAAALLAAANAAPAIVTGMPAPAMTAYAAMVDDVTNQKVIGDGYAPLDPKFPVNVAKIRAREAAKVLAERALIGEVQGLTLNSETTVKEMSLESDVVNRKINGTLKGAKIVVDEMMEDGVYHIQMEVPMYGVGSIAEATIPALTNGAAAVPAAAPSASYVPTETAAAAYTGLIIDAKGSGLERTFCPGIFDTNDRPIYGVANVDPNYAVRQGVAGYAEGETAWTQAEAGQSRAGANPLIIKAVGLRTRSTHNCDIVVTPEDGDRILAANQQYHFLDNYAVTLEM